MILLVFESQESCSSFPQEHWDISKCATESDCNQAYIGRIKATHMVLEKKVLLWVTKLTDVVCFLCFFFVFNLSYMSGTNSFYQFV